MDSRDDDNGKYRRHPPGTWSLGSLTAMLLAALLFVSAAGLGFIYFGGSSSSSSSSNRGGENLALKALEALPSRPRPAARRARNSGGGGGSGGGGSASPDRKDAAAMQARLLSRLRGQNADDGGVADDYRSHQRNNAPPSVHRGHPAFAPVKPDSTNDGRRLPNLLPPRPQYT